MEGKKLKPLECTLFLKGWWDGAGMEKCGNWLLKGIVWEPSLKDFQKQSKRRSEECRGATW